MRKLFSNGLVVVAGVFSLPHPVSHATPQVGSIAEYQPDPRLSRLQKFFEKVNSPVRSLASVFLQAADEHDLDWRLLPSLSFIESTAGKFAPGNNLFGWDCGRAKFASMGAAIHSVALSLSQSAPYKNKTLDRILATYNPNADYAAKVKSVMRRIAPTENPE